MLNTKELPGTTLGMMNPFGQSATVERQRQCFFGHMFGPEGRVFYRGIRDGSVNIVDLAKYMDGIGRHFSAEIRERYKIPGHIRTEDIYVDLQGIRLGVVRKIIDEAFPQRGRKLGQFKNEVQVKPPSPSMLFKILALPEGQVDRRLVLDTTRLLITGDTAGPLYVKSKHADLNQIVSDWIDVANEELFEGPYGAGEEYVLNTYHDGETNTVVRFPPKGEIPKPTREGETFAMHPFIARRIKGYGLAYVDITEVGVVEATIQTLMAAANNNGGKIQPDKDGRVGIKMTVVDLEDNPRRNRKDFNQPHLTALKARVMGGFILKHMDIESMNILSDPQAKRSNVIEIYDKNIPGVPIRLEFWNRKDYLNRNYHVGTKSLVDGIPEPVYNGKAEELSRLRDYYHLVPYLFPREFFGDTQSGLIIRMEEVAAQLKQECTSQVNHFGQEDIQALFEGVTVSTTSQ